MDELWTSYGGQEGEERQHEQWDRKHTTVNIGYWYNYSINWCNKCHLISLAYKRESLSPSEPQRKPPEENRYGYKANEGESGTKASQERKRVRKSLKAEEKKGRREKRQKIEKQKRRSSAETLQEDVSRTEQPKPKPTDCPFCARNEPRKEGSKWTAHEYDMDYINKQPLLWQHFESNYIRPQVFGKHFIDISTQSMYIDWPSHFPFTARSTGIHGLKYELCLVSVDDVERRVQRHQLEFSAACSMLDAICCVRCVFYWFPRASKLFTRNIRLNVLAIFKLICQPTNMQ